jgi:hypothetical protein
MNRFAIQISIFMCALGAITLRAAPASALGSTVSAEVALINDTNCALNIPSGDAVVDGVWGPSQAGSWYNDTVATPGGAPSAWIAAQQTGIWRSNSNNGLFGTNGTGGQVTIPLNGGAVGLDWSLPWTYFNGGSGVVGDERDGKTSTVSNSDYQLTGGVFGCGGDTGNDADTCIWIYELQKPGINTQCLYSMPPTPGMMKKTQALSRGNSAVDRLNSAGSSSYYLIMQTDGNLVFYGPSGAIWSSGTYSTSAQVAVMQADGNFVVYDVNGTALWNSGTYGHPGASLIFNDSGGMFVVAADGSTLLWSGGAGLF